MIFFTKFNKYFILKVVAICGIFGSCRRYELCDLRLSDIKKEGSVLIINIRPSKTEKGRKFAVVDNDDISYVKLFNKYLSLRPENISTDRVFLKYANGKCIKQVVGINTFGKCPSLLARFLNLPDATKYTGHAFRRSSATIMANSGMSVDELKRQVGWKSSTVASGYIEESIQNKISVTKRIGEALTSTQTILKDNIDIPANGDSETINTQLKSCNFHIADNKNCNFYINLNKNQ